MTSKQRVLAAFGCQDTDRVPIYMGSISSRVASAALGRDAYVGGGMQQYRESKALWDGEGAHAEFVERSRRDAFDIAKVLDLDLVRPSYWRMSEKPTRRIDELTFFYGAEDADWKVMRYDPDTELYQVTASSPRPEPTIDDIEAQVARMTADAQEAHARELSPDAFPDIRDALAEFGEERAVSVASVGVSIPRDTHWLMATVLRPDLVGAYLELSARAREPVVKALTEMGAQILFGGGDFASYKGPMYSPKVFHDLMLPALQIVSDICHRYGAYHCFASDGDLWPVAEDLFGHSGVDAFYEIDRLAGMDLRRLREAFPKLTLLGNISSHTLHVGTREEVVQETRSCLEAAKECRGTIVGASNMIVSQTPLENFFAMMETIRENR